MFDKVPLGRKLILIAAVALVGLTVVAWFGLHTLYVNLRIDREVQTQNLVHSSVTAVGALYEASQSGDLTVEEARSLALDLVRALRYGHDDYFFVFDQEVVILAHGWDRSLEGRDLSHLEDVNGKRFAEELVVHAMRDDSAFVDYFWPRSGSTVPVEKISYAEHFEPWGWVLVSGIYIDDIDDVYYQELIGKIWICLIIVLFMCGALVLLSRSVTRPINRLSAAMRRLAEGDRTIAIPARDWKNEIGLMAATVQVFKEQAIEKAQLEDEQDKAKQRAEQDKREMMTRLADGFESSVGGIVQAVSSAAREMQSTAQSMSSVSDDANRQSANVAAAALEAAANVETVASAAKQLGSSIADISHQVQQQRDVAGVASQAAATTNEDIGALAGRADKIGAVISLITGIAEQTNLLALNATIEAARAGEAGKGFAVVASEVKSLANQTARATEEIGEQIRSMQDQTSRTVTSIETITAKISELNDIASAVAAAVEQQNSATQEIARNANEAAAGTGQVTRSIDDVSRSASEAGGAAGLVLSASEDVSQHARRLTEEVQGFLQSIRAV